MILEWKEYMDRYQTECEHKGWCKITASVTKPAYGLKRFGININYEMEDGTQYSFNINSPLGGDEAKELAEAIILNFKPELVPIIKNPQPEINKYEDGAIIKYEDKENRHEITIKMDGKRYSFIRVFNRYDFECVILDYSKKIKFKKIDNKEEHFQLGIKERENFNLYIPQIERVINKFKALKDIKERIINRGGYGINYMEIDEKVDNYTKYILKETIEYFNNNDYSNEPNYNISTDEQKLANNLKPYLSKYLKNQTQNQIITTNTTENKELKCDTKKRLKRWQRVLIILGLIILIGLL